MAREIIDIGSVPNDGTGDPICDCWIKVNNMTSEIYTVFGDGSSLNATVSSIGTPTNNQLVIWTDGSTVEGDSKLTWDGTTLAVSGAVTVNTTLDVTGLATLNGDALLSKVTPVFTIEDTNAASGGLTTITGSPSGGILVSADASDVEADTSIGFEVDGAEILSLFSNESRFVMDGPLKLGVDDTQYGRMYLYGDGTGSTTGGQIRFYSAADYDTTTNYYELRAESANLELVQNNSDTIFTFNETTDALEMSKPFKDFGTVVASLPNAATVGAGARAFITDATATTFASIVSGGGANSVPVYSDGTDWRIG